jgi:hypothetical protein
VKAKFFPWHFKASMLTAVRSFFLLPACAFEAFVTAFFSGAEQ